MHFKRFTAAGTAPDLALGLTGFPFQTSLRGAVRSPLFNGANICTFFVNHKIKADVLPEVPIIQQVAFAAGWQVTIC